MSRINEHNSSILSCPFEPGDVSIAALLVLCFYLLLQSPLNSYQDMAIYSPYYNFTIYVIQFIFIFVFVFPDIHRRYDGIFTLGPDVVRNTYNNSG